MIDKQRTCGDCAWFRDNNCCADVAIDVKAFRKINDNTDATECKVFRSHSDQSLIEECHRLRSLGAALEWSQVDRLVEIAAGWELERERRCYVCEGSGYYGMNLHGDRVECDKCHGTGKERRER